LSWPAILRLRDMLSPEWWPAILRGNLPRQWLQMGDGWGVLVPVWPTEKKKAAPHGMADFHTQ